MDKFEMIKQFKDLLDNGIITQEEFDQKKSELLGVGVNLQKQNVDKDVVEINLESTELIDSQEKTVEGKETQNDAIEEPSNVMVPHEESTVQIDGNESAKQVASNNEASAAEQKSASMKGMILVGVIGVFALLIILAIIGSAGSGGIKGSWNCSSVVYQGEKLDASDAQADDYTLKFTDSNFEANIYGAQASGTYEYTDTMTLDDGMEVDIYTLTADGGAELTVAYYKSENVITLSPFGGVSSSTFIEFKRR